MRKAIVQSIWILGISAALACASFALRPEALPHNVGEFQVSLEEAQAMDGVLWIDARTEPEFSNGHLDGAILLNEEDWEAGFVGLLDAWAPGSPIVVYCSTQACMRSHHVAERLRKELGVEEIFSLEDGWEGLLDAGLAEEGER